MFRALSPRVLAVGAGIDASSVDFVCCGCGCTVFMEEEGLPLVVRSSGWDWMYWLAA